MKNKWSKKKCQNCPQIHPLFTISISRLLSFLPIVARMNILKYELSPVGFFFNLGCPSAPKPSESFCCFWGKIHQPPFKACSLSGPLSLSFFPSQALQSCSTTKNEVTSQRGFLWPPPLSGRPLCYYLGRVCPGLRGFVDNETVSAKTSIVLGKLGR